MVCLNTCGFIDFKQTKSKDDVEVGDKPPEEVMLQDFIHYIPQMYFYVVLLPFQAITAFLLSITFLTAASCDSVSSLRKALGPLTAEHTRIMMCIFFSEQEEQTTPRLPPSALRKRPCWRFMKVRSSDQTAASFVSLS